MKAYWQRIAGRIDDMTLRQRAMLFATISLVLVVLVHATLIEPVLARQKGLIDAVNRDQSQLTAVRAQIESMLKEQDAGRRDPERTALAALEARVAEAEKALAVRKQAFVAPTRLPALLKELLGPGQPVRMEALRVVPGTQVKTAAELYQHGVELTLRGSYFDLAQYLAALEKLPVRFLWGRLEMQVDQYPEVRLSLQLRTLSPQRSLGL